MHRIDIPDWAIARGRSTQHFAALNGPRCALLAIDLQQAFTLPGQVFGNPYAEAIIPLVNQLARATRTAGGRVFWTRQSVSNEAPRALPDWFYDESDPMVARAKAALTPGAQGHALHDDCECRPEDRVIDKYRYSAFARDSSTLDEQLRSECIDTLIIAGTLTNCCCDSTARDASQMGYKVFFASDATATVTDAEHNAALLNLILMFADVRSTRALLSLLSG